MEESDLKSQNLKLQQKRFMSLFLKVKLRKNVFFVFEPLAYTIKLFATLIYTMA
jgi:hypothetical protein